MKQLFLPAAVSAVSLLAAFCAGQADPASHSSESAGPSEAAPSVTVGAATASETPAFSSEVSKLVFEPVAQLPRPPASAARAADCAGVLVDAKSAAAKVVAKAGWGVTGEARIGGYQLVSFAGSFEPGTSGSCLLGKGSVGVFTGTSPLAVAYVRSGGQDTIGRIQPFGTNGVRIWDGDIVPAPIADIRQTRQGLMIVKLAAEEQTCAGAVPTINGMPISRARKALIAAGWQPVAHGDPDAHTGEREKALAGLGVIEVDSCSGTGFGYCAFDYRKGTATLGVITVGEDEYPSVSHYSVRCN